MSVCLCLSECVCLCLCAYVCVYVCMSVFVCVPVVVCLWFGVVGRVRLFFVCGDLVCTLSFADCEKSQPQLPSLRDDNVHISRELLVLTSSGTRGLQPSSPLGSK